MASQCASVIISSVNQGKLGKSEFAGASRRHPMVGQDVFYGGEGGVRKTETVDGKVIVDLTCSLVLLHPFS